MEWLRRNYVEPLVFLSSASEAPLPGGAISCTIDRRGNIHADWFVGRSAKCIVICFSGNDQPSFVEHILRPMRRLLLDTATFFVPHLTLSDGEQALKEKACLCYQYVVQEYETCPIVLVGDGIGTSLALHVALLYGVDALVLVSPFRSILRSALGMHLPYVDVLDNEQWLRSYRGQQPRIINAVLVHTGVTSKTHALYMANLLRPLCQSNPTVMVNEEKTDDDARWRMIVDQAGLELM
jgi:hypothetical protein